MFYRFDEDRRSARVVFRKLASGGGVIALPQRLRRAGGACAQARNGRVSPSTLALITHPEAVIEGARTRCARPRSIRSRHSQGRRPYEPSVRRDPGRFAQVRGGAGRTVRGRAGVLKGLGNSGAAILSTALNPSSLSLLPMGEGVARATDEGRRWVSANAVAGAVGRLTPKDVESPSPPTPSPTGEGTHRRTARPGYPNRRFRSRRMPGWIGHRPGPIRSRVLMASARRRRRWRPRACRPPR